MTHHHDGHDHDHDHDGSDAKDALKRDWEQTKSDLPGDGGTDLDQNVGDTVRQATDKD